MNQPRSELNALMSDSKKSWADSGCLLFGAVMCCPLLFLILEIVGIEGPILNLGLAITMGILLALFKLGIHRAEGRERLSLKRFNLMQIFCLFVGLSIELGLGVAWFSGGQENFDMWIFAGLLIVPNLAALGLKLAEN